MFAYCLPARFASRIRRRHSIITGVDVLAMQVAFLIALYFIIHWAR
jgi:hypothetical protein